MEGALKLWVVIVAVEACCAIGEPAARRIVDDAAASRTSAASGIGPRTRRSASVARGASAAMTDLLGFGCYLDLRERGAGSGSG